MDHNQPLRPAKKVKNNNLWVGLLFLIIGSLLMSKQVGADIPGWVFSWPMILIVVGLFIGLKTGFRDFGWLIMIGIGLIFLVDDIVPEANVSRYGWPLLFISIGAFLMFAGGRCSLRKKTTVPEAGYTVPESSMVEVYDSTNADVVEIVSILGGQKRLVLSKNFKGGEVVAVLGGIELNLSQADFQNTIVMEVVQIFGGTKLIIPANWDIITDTVAILGGVDDKRVPTGLPPEKTLVLKGVTIFGGIEIKSF